MVNTFPERIKKEVLASSIALRWIELNAERIRVIVEDDLFIIVCFGTLFFISVATKEVLPFLVVGFIRPPISEAFRARDHKLCVV